MLEALLGCCCQPNSLGHSQASSHYWSSRIQSQRENATQTVRLDHSSRCTTEVRGNAQASHIVLAASRQGCTEAAWAQHAAYASGFLKGWIEGVDTPAHDGMNFLFFFWSAGRSASHAPSVVRPKFSRQMAHAPSVVRPKFSCLATPIKSMHFCAKR